MLLPRPAAGGESCKQAYFYWDMLFVSLSPMSRKQVQMILLQTKKFHVNFSSWNVFFKKAIKKFCPS